MKQVYRFGRHASLFFAVALAVALVLCLASLFLLKTTLAKHDATIIDDLQVALTVEKLRSVTERRAASYRGFILTGDRNFVKTVMEADVELDGLLEKLAKVLVVSSERTAFKKLKQTENEYLSKVIDGIRMKEKRVDQKEVAAFFEKEILPRANRISEQIRAISQDNEKELIEAELASAKATNQALVFTIIITASALIFCFGSVFVMYRLVCRQAQELAEANKRLWEFCSVASHDLKSPLSTVIGYLQLIQDEYNNKLDETANKWIKMITTTATRMMALIDKLLAYGRVGRGNVDLQPVDLNIAVNEALENLNEDLVRNNAQILRGTLPMVRADRAQMVQLFQNLIGNGMKFHKEGVQPRIEISAKRVSKDWVLGVTDNGIGIESPVLDKVFEPFAKFHNGTDYAGHGIGLAVCKKIVDWHGGQIWAESTLGQGTSIFFSLSPA